MLFEGCSIEMFGHRPQDHGLKHRFSGLLGRTAADDVGAGGATRERAGELSSAESPFSHVELERSAEGYWDRFCRILHAASESLIKRGLEPI